MKTDSQIQAAVIAKLKWESAVDPTSIGVEVKDGVVTLSGQVASFTAKYAAERAAQRVPGVKALAIQMDVARPGDPEHAEAEIARAVELALESKHGLARTIVNVMVEDGCVTLSGETESDHLRRAAADTASHVKGVTGVRDRMSIKAPLSPAVVKAEFAVALERRCGVDPDDIATQLL